MPLQDFLHSQQALSPLSFSFHLTNQYYPWVLGPEFYNHQSQACMNVKATHRTKCYAIDIWKTRERLAKKNEGYLKHCHGGIHEYVQPVRYGGSLIAVCFIAAPLELVKYLPEIAETIEILYQKDLELLSASAGHDQSSIEMKILSWISRNYTNTESTLVELAAFLHLSPSRTSQIIRNRMNSSFPKLLQKMRIIRSRALLEVTDKPVAEIAEETGFNETGYFFRLFKSETGLSPLQYRKNLKREKEHEEP